jgi:hypothetical protein
VPDPRYPWTVTDGPWFDNNIALCHLDDDAIELEWVTGVVRDDPDHPTLRTVYQARIEPVAIPAASGTSSRP